MFISSSFSNSLSELQQLGLYRHIFINELTHKLKIAKDSIQGYPTAKTDLTNKMLRILGVTAITKKNGNDFPIMQSNQVPSTNWLEKINFIRQREEENLQNLSQWLDPLKEKELIKLVKKVGTLAMKRYETSICQLKGEKEILTFAKSGIQRTLEYLDREKQPFKESTLLNGFMKGKSGREIHHLKNTHLQCKNGQKFTIEGAYGRGALCFGDGVWIFPKTKEQNHTYTKFTDKGPKYYVHVSDPVDGSQLSTITPPSFVIKTCTLQDVEGYIQAFQEKKESFNDYLRRTYPGTQMGICSGEDLTHLDLSGKDFSGCDLSGCTISGSLRNTNFYGCNLANVQLKDITSAEGANFTRADLMEANLKGNFQGAKFNLADLRYATLEGDFTLIQYIGAIWAGANIEKMKMDRIEYLLDIQKKQLDDPYMQQEWRIAFIEQKKKLKELDENNKIPSNLIKPLKNNINSDKILIYACQEEIAFLNKREIKSIGFEKVYKSLKDMYDSFLTQLEEQQNIYQGWEESLDEVQRQLKQLHEDLLVLKKIKDKKTTLQELKQIPIEKIKRCIAQDSNNSILYANFAGALYAQGYLHVTLPSGKIMTPQGLYLEAIKRDPTNSYAYSGLATILEEEGIQFPNGTWMTKQDLYQKAIELDPTNSDAYSGLATILKEEDVQFSNGIRMTKRDLYLKKISLNPQDPTAYIRLGEILSKKEKVTLFNGKEMTQNELFLKAIDFDPKNPLGYFNLGNALDWKFGIILLDGTMMSKQQLLLKAIILDPNSKAYEVLEKSSLTTIWHLDGTQITKAQLTYLRDIHFNPRDAKAYGDLAATLTSGKSIRLFNDTIMTQKELYVKSIKLNPNYFRTYSDLGTILNNKEHISLPSGEMTRQKLYLKTIHLEPTYAKAYLELANTLSEGKRITLLNSKEVSKRDLILEALKRDPKDPMAYNNLATTLKEEERIKLPDGTMTTKQDLYLKAIDLDPDHVKSYSNLANTLPRNGNIQLINKTWMSKQNLLEKAKEDTNSHNAIGK